MQFFPFKPKHTRTPFPITYDAIRNALDELAKNPAHQKAGCKYAVLNPAGGDTFSPKDVLRQVIHSDRRFPGGRGFGATNEVFEAFGFPIGKMAYLKRRHAALKTRMRKPVTTNGLLNELFSKKWRLIPTKGDIVDPRDVDNPGVYILAYSRNLRGKRIREEDIFYVGMATEGGLVRRLGEFRGGIRNGRTHSGAMRFFRVWLGRRPYKSNSPYKLYFAYVPVKCEKGKEWRTLDDLRRLGKVVELEYAVMARVKHKIGHEPLLNKK